MPKFNRAWAGYREASERCTNDPVLLGITTKSGRAFLSQRHSENSCHTACLLLSDECKISSAIYKMILLNFFQVGALHKGYENR